MSQGSIQFVNSKLIVVNTNETVRVSRRKNVRSKFEEDFYLSENGQPIILLSMTDCVQMQSETASLSHECM